MLVPHDARAPHPLPCMPHLAFRILRSRAVQAAPRGSCAAPVPCAAHPDASCGASPCSRCRTLTLRVPYASRALTPRCPARRTPNASQSGPKPSTSAVWVHFAGGNAWGGVGRRGGGVGRRAGGVGEARARRRRRRAARKRGGPDWERNLKRKAAPEMQKRDEIEDSIACVARAGIEPATFHFSGERYYHLSYLAVEANSSLQRPRRDSNPRPPP